jgi:hypothetical protein
MSQPFPRIHRRIIAIAIIIILGPQLVLEAFEDKQVISLKYDDANAKVIYSLNNRVKTLSEIVRYFQEYKKVTAETGCNPDSIKVYLHVKGNVSLATFFAVFDFLHSKVTANVVCEVEGRKLVVVEKQDSAKPLMGEKGYSLRSELEKRLTENKKGEKLLAEANAEHAKWDFFSVDTMGKVWSHKYNAIKKTWSREHVESLSVLASMLHEKPDKRHTVILYADLKSKMFSEFISAIASVPNSGMSICITKPCGVKYLEMKILYMENSSSKKRENAK